MAVYLDIVERRKTDAARKVLQSDLDDLKAALADIARLQEDTIDEIQNQQRRAKQDAEHQKWMQRQRMLNQR